ncbi:ATP-binding protein [Sphingomonas sp. CFBP 8760]|uniref:ATP-binding protein n=1 Tax=Sphingomonas sp. CFBP 8760 TaxID=2775282 RepID=UPI00177DE08E|nr:ATP-binding protein [Sphingomonas sp. CFBP 8760]MBD8549027.1 ATP-binding protein [Sphingomonas sp. CFBP 8760]
MWTKRSWDEIEKTNRVARALKSMEHRANEVADGLKRAAFLYGPTGVGKTRTVDHALTLLKIEGRNPIECQPSNYKEMLANFEEADGHRPVFFDEADVIWRSSRMLNILKIATDPRREPYQRVYGNVNIAAPIFVTTNVDLSDRSAWDKPLLTHGDALFRRVSPRGVPADRDALFEYSVGLALYQKLLETYFVEDGQKPRRSQSRPAARRSAAIKWFSENRDNLTTISPGTLEAVAAAFDYDDDIEREGDLEPLLKPVWKRSAPRTDATDWLTLIKQN